MRLAKLRKQTIAELNQALDKESKELQEYQFDLKVGKEKNSARPKVMRRKIAQLLTIIREKQLLAEYEKETKTNVEPKVEVPVKKEKEEETKEVKKETKETKTVIKKTKTTVKNKSS